MDAAWKFPEFDKRAFSVGELVAVLVVSNGPTKESWKMVLEKTKEGYWYRRSTGTAGKNPPYSGPFDSEEEAKDVATVVFRMGV